MGQSVGVSVVCNSATVSDIRRHPSQSVNLARVDNVRGSRSL